MWRENEMDCQETIGKEAVRDLMRQKRKKLSAENRKVKNDRIRERFLALEEIRSAERFFSFVSYGTEADTVQLIQCLLSAGKMVAVPRVSGREMDFYEIRHLEQLSPGYQGIPEPPAVGKVTAESGVMLLPGLAFDRQRNRVGYGGGYYDRYLAQKAGENLVTVALAYDFQVVDKISVEDFDWKPDILVTDRQVICE